MSECRLKALKKVPPQGCGFPQPLLRDKYLEFIQKCSVLDSKYDASTLMSYGDELSKKSDKINKILEKFLNEIKEYPVIAMITNWAKTIKSTGLANQCVETMDNLISKQIIPFKSTVRDDLMSLGEFFESDREGVIDFESGHQAVIDAIRCVSEWPLAIQEAHISIYMEFALWLCVTSFGHFPSAYDHDRTIAGRRKLKFEQYIQIIQELSDRERILAKLFYLGGSRSLEEVLSLKIEDINFRECTLRLSDDNVFYPKHVFNDLKTYIVGRKKGPVFIGRNGKKWIRLFHTGL